MALKSKQATGPLYITNRRRFAVVLFTLFAIAVPLTLGGCRLLPTLQNKAASLLHPTGTVTHQQATSASAVTVDATQTPLSSAVSQLENRQWSDDPHCSFLYSSAHADDGKLYFLPDAEYTAESSRLCRMNDDGTALEEILPIAGLDRPVKAFTVMGDTIYYSIALSETVCGYFSIPKQGGVSRFLFLEEYSTIVPRDGMLYFLFQGKDALGIYNPTQDDSPRLLPLNDGDTMTLPGFSLIDGALYYGVHSAAGESFYRLTLATLSKVPLLSTEQTGEKNLRNPFFTGGSSYYVMAAEASGNAYFRVWDGESDDSRVISKTSYKSQSGRLLSAARLGDQVFYQYETEYRLADLNAPLQDYKVIYTGDNRPFAVAGRWLINPQSAVSLDGEKTVYFSDIAKNPLGDADSAYKLALYTLEDMATHAPTPTETPRPSAKPTANPATPSPKPTAAPSWTDCTGYKPKYFSWSTEGEIHDDPDIHAGKWVSKDGKTVAYLDFDDSPDVMNFEIYYKGKVYHGGAMLMLDGNTKMAVSDSPNVSVHLNRQNGLLLLCVNGNDVTIKLIRRKFK